LEAVYKVAIIGAGVGGSYLSYRLAKYGLDTIIFDFRAPHEKLCGGGISYKALAQFPVLQELPCPRKVVWKAAFISPKNRTLILELARPLTIFKRRDLDSSLLTRAQELGVHFRREKVRSFTLMGDHWKIVTDRGEYRAEKLVGADGALSRTRRKLQQTYQRGELFFALQCFLPVQEDVVTYKFFPELQGYLWAFPRIGTLAIGIVTKDPTRENYRDMRKKLLSFIERYYPGKTKGISLRGAYIPFFSAGDLSAGRICSDSWALIGDAARFVDPISGEGMYYALSSAEILASCIRENELPLYQGLCREGFGSNLIKASQDFHYVYQPEFLEAMTAMAARSAPVRRIVCEMIEGDLNYLTWKGRFRSKLVRIAADFILKSDMLTKREVMGDLLKLSLPRLRPYPKVKIS
jgi:geranylgeranyl reductase family protein